MGVGAGLGVTAWPIMLTCALLRKASSLLRSDPMWAQCVTKAPFDLFSKEVNN